MRRPAVRVGNDVVDLDDPRTSGKAGDERFVARILDAAGLAALREADDPDLELWCRWAAKEAAYKVASKLAGTPPPFVHRAFGVTWGAADARATGAHPAREARPIRHGVVTYEGRAIPVLVTCGVEAGRPCALHALARFGPASRADGWDVAPGLDLLDRRAAPWSGSLEDLERRLTERELDGVRTRRSAAVRLAARASLAGRMGLPEERVEIVCDSGPLGRRPPRVLVDGEPSGADVSLSHDGRWIAWSSWTAPGAGGAP
jgi:phosphopantetheinyl transferase (holo-ACP synthase)